jgi:tRNA modification GTPase
MPQDTALSDTIVARATPPGEGGVAIVRLSGPEAVGIVDTLYDGEQSLSSVEGGRVVHGWIRSGPVAVSSGTTDRGADIIDEVLVTIMRAPKSYTREDVVEIGCHGGMRVTDEIVRACVTAGARHAERGEFTQRAFLNGRLDLAQAEGVLDLIQARTRSGIDAALYQLRGSLSDDMHRVSGVIAASLARIEAGLEFDEDDLGVGDPTNEADAIRCAHESVEKLRSTYDRGRLIARGAVVAIVGSPNVGKSSLLNAIVGEERAIVSTTPGTTRDLVEAEVELDGLSVRFVDTAGLRYTDDHIEREGTRRAEHAGENADITLVVCDASGEIPAPKNLPGAKRIFLTLNKADRSDADAVAALRELGVQAKTHLVSALSGEGVDQLVQSVRDALVEDSELTVEGSIVTRERHANALQECSVHLSRAIGQITPVDLAVDADRQVGADDSKVDTDDGKVDAVDSKIDTVLPDLVAADLRLALDAIGEITGETTPDDILNAIFGDFCIGK